MSLYSQNIACMSIYGCHLFVSKSAEFLLKSDNNLRLGHMLAASTEI